MASIFQDQKILTTNKKSPVELESSFALHIVTKQDYIGNDLKPGLKKIQNSIYSLLLEKYPDNKDYYSNISLRAFDGDFAVVTVNRPTGAGPIDELVNLKTGESKTLSATNSSVLLGKGIMYVESNLIRYYSFSSKSLNVITDSVLRNNETYNSGGDMKVTPEEVHTNSSLTISIFDSSTVVSGAGTADYKFKKLRKQSFSFKR